MHRLRRIAASIAAATLGLGLAVTGWASPAAAEIFALQPKTWAYTDSRSPQSSFVNRAEDAPVGARLDADRRLHKSRFYVAYDISRFRGQVIHQADLWVDEGSVRDCATEATVELWRTGRITDHTSWQTPPAELERIGQAAAGGSASCPGLLTYDVVPALNAALRRHDEIVSLELRIPQAREADPALGRVLSRRPVLYVTANHPPTVSDPKLLSPDQPCGTRQRHPAVNGYVTLSAKITERDPDQYVTSEFAVWPLNHPDQRQLFPGGMYGDGTTRREIDISAYPHGTRLVWSVRAFDQQDYSRPAGPCYLQVDREAPERAPIVTSSLYRDTEPPGQGGPGIAGRFKFDAQGDRDVVGYEYTNGDGAYTTVRAPYPGAAVTIRYTPTRRGPNTLSVRSVDAAHNRGPATEYDFWVRDTAPWVTVDVAGVHLPSQVTMRSAAPDVTGFGFRVDDGREVRVPAVDGVGHGQVTFTHTGTATVTARSFAGNRVIGVSQETVHVSDEPTVESADFNFDHDGVVGRPGTFTFRPRTTSVVAYLYSFGNEEPQRLAAAPDGTATLRWTPEAAGFHTLYVRSVRADGGTSETATHQFSVIDPRPSVYSGDLVVWPRRDGVGVPLEFEFSTRMPDVEAFMFLFDDGPEQTVPATYGSARTTLTPDHAGENTIVVRSRFADGTLSPANTWRFEVSSGPIVRWEEFPGGIGGQTGKPATFTFRPGLPGVAEYRYTFDGEEEQTVAAAPDGTATVVYTPTRPAYRTVQVFSRSGDGTVSDIRTYEFIVRDPTVGVHSYFYGDDTRGGIGRPGQMAFSTELFGEVVEYRYRLNDGPEQSVPASTDGVSTYVWITPDRNGENTLTVQSRTAAGDLSPVTEFRFMVGTAPYVTSAEYPYSTWGGGIGVTGTFVFSGGTAGIVAFEYQVDDGETQTVGADTDGRATVTFTPATSYEHAILVHGRKADGSLTDANNYYFLVRP